MKVSTDSRLLAAYAGQHESNFVLDVGCGIGIISFLLASNYPQSSFTGIDLDADAIELANKSKEMNTPNFRNINFFHSSIQLYNSVIKYDLIVSNPPFYIDQLKSPNPLRNQFRHTESDFISSFAQKCSQLCNANGSVIISIPPQIEHLWSLELNREGFSLNEWNQLRNTEDVEPFLLILIYSKKFTQLKKKELILCYKDGTKTEDYLHIMERY